MLGTRWKFISNLEKAKAGLGAAGMTAVGLEAFGPPKLLGEAFGAIPFVGAVLAGLIAIYFAGMSETEARLELEAGRVRASRDPAPKI
jgi:hypothetical protein